MFHPQLIQDLRDRRYTPAAWGDYVVAHLCHVRRLVEARPAVVRSIFATGFTMLALVFLVSVWLALSVDAALGRLYFAWTAIWLASHCGWLVLHMGLLVDREGSPMMCLGLPNTVTLLRSLTVPGMVLCMREGHVQLGLLLYALGGVADVLDGALARRRGQVTRLGIVMDPLVDIVWNSAAAYGLVLAGALSGWILGLLAFRYGLLLAGSTWLYLTGRLVRIRPTLFGKVSGAAIALVLILVFANRLMLAPDVSGALEDLLELCLGFLVTATIGYVIVLGVLNSKARAASVSMGRVVGDVGDAGERRSAGAGHGGS